MARPFVWSILSAALLGLTAIVAAKRLAAVPAGGARALAVAAPADLRGRVVVDSDARGHFMLDVRAEGSPVPMMLDTGASVVALTSRDAERAGIRPFGAARTVTLATANGTVPVTPVTLREVRVGPIAVRDVEAVIVPSDRLGTSLLGLSFLRRLKGYDVSGRQLTLRD